MSAAWSVKTRFTARVSMTSPAGAAPEPGRDVVLGPGFVGDGVGHAGDQLGVEGGAEADRDGLREGGGTERDREDLEGLLDGDLDGEGEGGGVGSGSGARSITSLTRFFFSSALRDLS